MSSGKCPECGSDLTDTYIRVFSSDGESLIKCPGCRVGVSG